MRAREVWAFLNQPRRVHCPSMHTIVHQGDHWAHRAYLVCVSLEVHYWYGKVALIMLVFEVMSVFTHTTEGAE
jgi:hypothetical protein